MTNLINPKPRFGYNPTADTMYDYIDGKDVPISPSYVASDATWNLVKAKALILAGQPVESARSGPGSGKTPAQVQMEAARAKKPAPAAAASSSSAAVNFSPIQAAALGISVNESASQLTPAQLANIKEKITPARAIALKLSPAQRSALGV